MNGTHIKYFLPKILVHTVEKVRLGTHMSGIYSNRILIHRIGGTVEGADCIGSPKPKTNAKVIQKDTPYPLLLWVNK